MKCKICGRREIIANGLCKRCYNWDRRRKIKNGLVVKKHKTMAKRKEKSFIYPIKIQNKSPEWLIKNWDRIILDKKEILCELQ